MWLNAQESASSASPGRQRLSGQMELQQTLAWPLHTKLLMRHLGKKTTELRWNVGNRGGQSESTWRSYTLTPPPSGAFVYSTLHTGKFRSYGFCSRITTRFPSWIVPAVAFVWPTVAVSCRLKTQVCFTDFPRGVFHPSSTSGSRSQNLQAGLSCPRSSFILLDLRPRPDPTKTSLNSYFQASWTQDVLLLPVAEPQTCSLLPPCGRTRVLRLIRPHPPGATVEPLATRGHLVGPRH